MPPLKKSKQAEDWRCVVGELRQKFETWFKTTTAYLMLESMNYYKMDLFHFVDGRNEYRHTSVQVVFMTWVEQQSKIDQLEKELAQMKHINDEQNKNLETAFKTIEIQQKFDADSQGAIACLTEMNKRYLGKMQEQQDMVAELKDTISSAMAQLDDWTTAYKILSGSVGGEID